MPIIKLDVDGLRQADAALRRIRGGALGLATLLGSAWRTARGRSTKTLAVAAQNRTVARIAVDGPVPSSGRAVFLRHHPTGSRLGADFLRTISRNSGPESSGRHPLIHVDEADTSTRLGEWAKARAEASGLEIT